MRFVDTNIFIRYLTKDDPVKAENCYRLFKEAEKNQIDLTTSESVIAEVVFILSSKRLYHLSREEVQARLYPLISLQGLKIPHRRMYLRALDLYANNTIDFEDALSIAIMERQGIDGIISYDRDFDRVKDVEITRTEA